MRRENLYIVLIILAFASGYVFSYFFNLSFFSDKEKSYKTGKLESRYLSEFKRKPDVKVKDLSEFSEIDETQINNIENLLNESAQKASSFDWFNSIKDENVLVLVKDFGDYPFTIKIDEGVYNIERGYDSSTKPTMVVPLTAYEILSLEEMLGDGELSYEDQYKIYYSLAVPALNSLYNIDALYTSGDKSLLKFDDLIQIEVTPEEPVYVNEIPINIYATALNVDGQWFVMEGLHGDPDWKINLTLAEATSLYTMGVYETREVGLNPSKLADLSERFLELIENAKVYRRK